MYIYKREKNKYHLTDYVDSTDEDVIELRIIKLLRKYRECRNVFNINSKFTGLYTVYYFNGNFALIASKYQLNEDGTVKMAESHTVAEVNSTWYDF